MAGKTEYKNTWQRENVDRVNLTMPKGKKDAIKTHAETRSESVNGFINRAIDNQMAQDRDKGPSEAAQATPGAGVVSLSPDALETAQRAAEAAGEATPQFIARAIDTQAKRDQSSLRLGINPATGEKLKGEA